MTPDSRLERLQKQISAVFDVVQYVLVEGSTNQYVPVRNSVFQYETMDFSTTSTDDTDPSDPSFVSTDFTENRPNVSAMPINRDEFDALPEDALGVKKGTNARRVLSFLARHDDAAFTRSEVRDGADIPDGSVGPVLGRLADDGLVVHEGQYWALASERLEAMDRDCLLDDLRAEWDEYL